MKKFLITILLFNLLVAACGKDSSSSGGDSIFSFDQTNEAAKIVEEANEELKKVRTLYKTNQDRFDQELMPAMAAKDVEKAKEVSNDLVIEINSGLESAKDAVKKIKEAEEKDINSTYKEYLQFKRESLEKQIEAFELRRQLAQQLNRSLGSKDPTQIAQANNAFKEKEPQFQALMKEGKDLSEKANEVYKNSLSQK